MMPELAIHPLPNVAGDTRDWWSVILDGAPVPSPAGALRLLEQALRRSALLVRPERTLVVLPRSHERAYAPALSRLDRGSVVFQALDRGSAPAVFHALLRVAAVAPTATVAILPGDHVVSDDGAFMAHVLRALEAVDCRPHRVVLLGVPATSAASDHEWIEPGASLGQGLQRVQRLVARPAPDLIARLLGSGAFWCTSVTVGTVSTLLTMVRQALPRLAEAFAFVRRTVGGPLEAGAAARAYVLLGPSEFTGDVLARIPSRLALLPVRGVACASWRRRPERAVTEPVVREMIGPVST